MTANAPDLSPIRRSVSVSWNQEAAFRRFTADFAKWWPRFEMSIGAHLIERVVFECKPGGLIYEEHRDGRRYQWGRVTAFDAPRRVSFRWWSSREESDAQDVDVIFTPEGTGTHVELVSTGWEKMSMEARQARGGYRLAWGVILKTYAGAFHPAKWMFTAMAHFFNLTGGRRKFVDNAKGRMEPLRRESVAATYRG